MDAYMAVGSHGAFCFADGRACQPSTVYSPWTPHRKWSAASSPAGFAPTPWLISTSLHLFEIFKSGWGRAQLYSSDINSPDLTVAMVATTSVKTGYWITKATELVLRSARIFGI